MSLLLLRPFSKQLWTHNGIWQNFQRQMTFWINNDFTVDHGFYGYYQYPILLEVYCGCRGHPQIQRKNVISDILEFGLWFIARINQNWVDARTRRCQQYIHRHMTVEEFWLQMQLIAQYEAIGVNCGLRRVLWMSYLLHADWKPITPCG